MAYASALFLCAWCIGSCKKHEKKGKSEQANAADRSDDSKSKDEKDTKREPVNKEDPG